MKNFFKNSFNFILNIKTIYIFIFSIIILNTIIIFNLYKKEQSIENIFRLHVFANSNNIEDQITKLKVASKIEDYIENNITTKSNNYQIMENIEKNKDIILQISNDTLKECNQNYSSKIKLGKIYYDNRYSVNVDMNKGNYNSLEIILGDGQGKNFWTLISPDKENIEKLKDYNKILPNLSNIYSDNNNCDNISSENQDIQYSSKILEIVNKFLK